MNSDQTNNPDVRPTAQNIPNNKSAFAKTPPFPRDFKTGFTPEFLKLYHKGVMSYTYRGIPCLKSPIDLAIYMLLIYEQRPQTIVEIGSFQGGAAIFYADICRAYDLNTKVVTVDFRNVQKTAATDTRVEFIQADAADLANSELNARLKTLPRPWLIIEDSAHTYSVTYAVLEFFKNNLHADEYLIIEDGVIEDQGANWRYDGGPNRAVHDFFTRHPDAFQIDVRYNDFFGPNTSFNPNGYLRKK